MGPREMADCRHDRELECHAPAVTVGYRRDEIGCLTYAPDRDRPDSRGTTPGAAPVGKPVTG
ncbi:hypothetical protein AAH978_09025 [Streptomyces sp. ZYX-F-203]